MRDGICVDHELSQKNLDKQKVLHTESLTLEFCEEPLRITECTDECVGLAEGFGCGERFFFFQGEDKACVKTSRGRSK